MAVLNTLSQEDAIDLVNREFEVALKPIPGTMKESGFVIVETVPENSGGTRRHKEAPHSNQYASYKAEGGQIVSTSVQQGYYKDTTAKEFAFGIDITYKMRKLNKKRDIYNAMKFIANSYPDREDLNLSLFFSFGTATSYTDKDGRTVDISTGASQSLWNTAHTLTGSTTTYRNRLANNPQFSEGALENMEDLARTEIYSNLGEQVTIDFDVLWTTNKPQLVNAARRLLQSTAQISATNEGVPNVYRAKYRHVVLNRADMNANGNHDSTKANYWGLASTSSSNFHHDIYATPEIRNPSAGNNGEDIETLDWTFKVIGMHDSCVVTGRGFLFSSGDGTA